MMLPVLSPGATYRFTLPRHARDVQLASRITVSAVTRPDCSDIRRRDVAVACLVLDGIPLALDDAQLAGGWQGNEADGR